MKKIISKRNVDYDLFLSSNFHLSFFLDERFYIFPIVIPNNTYVNIPSNEVNINNFLNRNKHMLENEDVNKFLDIINVDITPFVWGLMQQAGINIFIQNNNIFLRKDETYIILNNKNIDIDLVNKITRSYSNFDGLSSSLREELYLYLRGKIVNGIGHNELVNLQMSGYKYTLEIFEKEFLKSNEDFDLIECLFLYENLIRIKEQYLNQNYYLITQQELEELYHLLQLIKQHLIQIEG